MMKVYTQGRNYYTQLIAVTSKLLSLQYQEVPVKEDNQELMAKSQTGKFPVFETPEGVVLFETFAACKLLARKKRGFYGSNDQEMALVDQWIDYVSLNLMNDGLNLCHWIMGHEEVEHKNFGKVLGRFKQNLNVIEKHLKLRNFLVGYSLSIADVILVSNLMVPLQLFLDTAFRRDTIPNITRYVTIITEGRCFRQVYGKIHYCKKAFNLPHPSAFKKEESKDQKGQQKQQQQKQQQKQQPKNQEKKEEAKKPVEAPKEKEKTWEDLLPPLKLNFYEYKTLFTNSTDKRDALKQLWQQWEPEALTLFYVHYEKYQGEGEQLPQTNNLMNGFIQRIDDKLRKHSLGVMGVYGEEPNLEIKGVFIWRGNDLPQPMVEHPQFEYYKKRKLDVSKEEDRAIAENYLVGNEEELVDGMKCQTKKFYK